MVNVDELDYGENCQDYFEAEDDRVSFNSRSTLAERPPEKTRVCRNRAPPMQLRPKVWKITRILRLRTSDGFIVAREYLEVAREYGL